MSALFKSKQFYMGVIGKYALFTDPMSKGGGEKFTYQIPTMQALRGIVEANYWKPTLKFLIDEVKVLKSIQTETKSILLPMLNGGKDLSYFTYLKDVAYAVKFHFEWALERTDLKEDRNEKKHEQIILRSLSRGGRHDIFLGTRECVGEIYKITEEEYIKLNSPYSGNISFGIMFNSFTYGELDGKLYSNFAPVIMKNGVVNFLRPEECTIRHELHNYKIKEFKNYTYRNIDEE